MQVNQVNQTLSPNFQAKINKNTPCMKTACSYMERCKNLEYPWKDTKVELKLFNLIDRAFRKHPSKEVLNIDRTYKKEYFWGERATISSSRTKLVDVEPVRDDSIAGELGIIRRILDPENKDMFNRLLGVEHSDKYQKWWDQHISSIWNNVNDLFRENPRIFPNVTDKKYNECFQKQIDIYKADKRSKPAPEPEVIGYENSFDSF